MSVDQRTFRKALGCFASGVTVVTALHPESKKPVGVTVSAFCSLSLDPPLVLFCLGNHTASIEAYTRGGQFAVNVLAEGQRDLSIRFASRSEQRFSGQPYDTWTTGAPILPGCLVNMECSLVEARPLGDHLIVIGKVLKLKHQEGGAPLIYYRGSYIEYGGPPPPNGGEGA